MKTEAIRFCIQSQHGKEDYAEARKELSALLARLEELEAAEQSPQSGFPVCPADGHQMQLVYACPECHSHVPTGR